MVISFIHLEVAGKWIVVENLVWKLAPEFLKHKLEIQQKEWLSLMVTVEWLLMAEYRIGCS